MNTIAATRSALPKKRLRINQNSPGLDAGKLNAPMTIVATIPRVPKIRVGMSIERLIRPGPTPREVATIVCRLLFYQCSTVERRQTDRRYHQPRRHYGVLQRHA